MKSFNKTLIAAALLTTGAAAQAEVSGSAAIANTYLWRGFDLSYGSAVVSGSLDYSEGMFYAGVWGSSGDDTYGTEYDLYGGLAGEVDDFGWDIGYVSYNYPDCAPGTCDFREVILSGSYGPVGLTYADNADSGAYYVAASVDVTDSINLTAGFTDTDAAGPSTGYHLDATYSMGDLAFTLSDSQDDGAGYSEKVQFVVSYSIPIKM